MASKKEVKVPAGGLMANGFFWAMNYSVISIAITLFNKAVLSSYDFNSAMTLTLLQGIVTITCLEFMKWRGWVEYPSFNWATARKVAPLSFVFIAYVVISLISLERVNVPMFTALRRLTVVFVMIEEYFMLQITPSYKVMQSVGVMMLGAAIAAWKDLTFDPVSYFYLFLTNLFTSLYTVYINVVAKDTGLKQFAMLYYSNVTTMPVLAILAWWTGDIAKAAAFPYYTDVFFQINFQASIFLAFVLNVSTFYCTSLNSARTQTVVGQLKNFVAFLLGLVLFDDYIYDPINMFGLWVGFAGGVLYSYVTYAEKNAKSAANASAAVKDGAAAGSGAASSAAAGPVGGAGATAAALPAGASESDKLLAGDTEAGASGVQHGTGELRERAPKAV